MAKREHPRYETTEWPDWSFEEWPMMVYPGSADGGKTPDRHPTKAGAFLQTPVIVHSEEERRAVLEIEEPVEKEAARPVSTTLVDAGAGVKRLQTEDDQRLALITEAETLGVQIDKRWSVARMQDAIDTYKNAEPV